MKSGIGADWGDFWRQIYERTTILLGEQLFFCVAGVQQTGTANTGLAVKTPNSSAP